MSELAETTSEIIAKSPEKWDLAVKKFYSVYPTSEAKKDGKSVSIKLQPVGNAVKKMIDKLSENGMIEKDDLDEMKKEVDNSINNPPDELSKFVSSPAWNLLSGLAIPIITNLDKLAAIKDKVLEVAKSGTLPIKLTATQRKITRSEDLI